jgi:hypothetical protein
MDLRMFFFDFLRIIPWLIRPVLGEGRRGGRELLEA